MQSAVIPSAGDAGTCDARPVPDRLVLRPLRAEDADACHALFDADPDVWVFDPGRAYSRPERAAWARAKAAEWETPVGRLGLGCHALVPRSGERMIGCAGLAVSLVPAGLDGSGSSLEAELYFRLGRPFWGRGYALEACQRLVRLAFDTLGLPRVFCATSRRHQRALALMRRLGMEIDADVAPGAFWGGDPARGILSNPRTVGSAPRTVARASVG